MFKFGKNSNKILDTVNKYLKLSAETAIYNSKIDISIPEWGGLRTAKYQKELFDKGWSKVDGINKISNHQLKDEFGKSKALDLCAYHKGEQNWNKERLVYIAVLMLKSFEELKKLGKIPEDIYLHSGLFWKPTSDNPDGLGWDKGHFELRSYPQKINV